MRCPVDNETLVMTDRNGVEIDYCPKCRGVWLDRGELDKIIERGAAAPAPQAAAPRPLYQPEPPRGEAFAPPPHRDQGYREPSRDGYRGSDDDYRGHRKKKREGFLSDLFDF